MEHIPRQVSKHDLLRFARLLGLTANERERSNDLVERIAEALRAAIVERANLKQELAELRAYALALRAERQR